MPSVNTTYNYNRLDETVKLQRSQNIRNNTSSKLYATLMMAKEDNNKKGSAKITKIKDLLVADSKEQLSESDKEKIRYTLDYLRISGKNKDIFLNLKSDDFSKIKKHKTASKRTEELIQIIIEKASDGLNDKEKAEFKSDINEHVNAMMKGRNAEVGNSIAEEMSLTRLTTKRARYYGDRIKEKIKENTDEHGNIDWSKCYMDVIKYANYSALSPRRRTTHRYMMPIKFSRRNINKKTESTLKALKEKSEKSKDPKEMFAINYIVKRLQEAYNYYKEISGVSNTAFDDVQKSNEDRIYKNAA